MVLVDTSVWIDHLRRGEAALVRLLEEAQVLIHPFVVGELALGRPSKRDELLQALSSLPKVGMALDPEVLHFIETQDIAASGVGYIDAHLLASVRLTAGAALWTRDRRLLSLADRLGCSWTPKQH